MAFPASHTRDDYSLTLEYFEDRLHIIPAAVWQVPVFSIEYGSRTEETESRDVLNGQIDKRRLVYPQYRIELVPFETVPEAWGAWRVKDFHNFAAFLESANNLRIKTTIPEYEDIFDAAYTAGRFFNIAMPEAALDKEALWSTGSFTIEAQRPGVLS